VVDTRDFVSGDLTRRREGIVQLDVCGQPTAFPFAGSGVIPIPADTRLVYFGTRPRGLSLQVRLIEDDEGEWDALRHVEAFLGGAAGLPASLVTAAGKAGAGLAAAFVQFLRTRIRNHDEAIVYTTLDDGLHDGQNVALRFPREGRPRLTANLRILDLGVRGKAQSVAVRVATPRLSFTDQPIVESQRASGAGGRASERRYEVRRWLTERRGLRRFTFSAASGTRRFGMSTDFGPLDRTMGWERAELFEAQGVAAGDWLYVPFACSASLNSEALDVASTAALIEAGGELGEALAPAAKGVAAVARKTGQPLIELLNELSDSELPLFGLDGVLAVPAVPEADPIPAAGIVHLRDGGDAPRRAAVTLNCELRKWQPQPLGSFGLTIETRWP